MRQKPLFWGTMKEYVKSEIAHFSWDGKSWQLWGTDAECDAEGWNQEDAAGNGFGN